MMDIPSRISPQRYRNVLLAESAFWDLEMNIAAGWERTARLLARLVKHSQRKDPPELRHISMEFLKQRLFWSKQRRLQNWGEETRRLFPDLAPFPKGRIHLLPVRNESDRRPKVSVCMAAYNSARYIELQLRSILQQLSPEDEVI